MNDHILALLLLTALLVVMAVGANILNHASCVSMASVMQKEYNYGIMSGCMIKTEKGFIPIQNIRGLKE